MASVNSESGAGQAQWGSVGGGADTKGQEVKKYFDKTYAGQTNHAAQAYGIFQALIQTAKANAQATSADPEYNALKDLLGDKGIEQAFMACDMMEYCRTLPEQSKKIMTGALECYNRQAFAIVRTLHKIARSVEEKGTSAPQEAHEGVIEMGKQRGDTLRVQVALVEELAKRRALPEGARTTTTALGRTMSITSSPPAETPAPFAASPTPSPTSRGVTPPSRSDSPRHASFTGATAVLPRQASQGGPRRAGSQDPLPAADELRRMGQTEKDGYATRIDTAYRTAKASGDTGRANELYELLKIATGETS